MRSILILLFMIASIAFAMPTIPAANLDYLTDHPDVLQQRYADFNAQHRAALSAAASAQADVPGDANNKRDLSDFVPYPAPGASWPLWYRPTFQVGNSSFNLARLGARDQARVDLFETPVITAVDPSAGYWLTTDPIAGQLTTPTASYIWFAGPDGQMICFTNATAGFASQQVAHSAVTYVPLPVISSIEAKLGRRTIKIPVSAYFAFGSTGDFGKTHLGSMPFWGLVHPGTNSTLAFGFDQQAVVPQIPYGSGNCPVEQTEFVGGRYEFNRATSKILPLSAAPAGIFTADLSCYTNRDPAQGFSPLLPNYDSAVCGRC